MEFKNQILLIASLSSLFFSLPVDATWFPRNFISLNPNPSPYVAPPQLQPVQFPSPSPRPPSPAVSLSSSSLAFVDPSLKVMCDTTDYPLLCLSSIAPFFHGNTDLVSILKLAINATLEYTNLALDDASDFAKSPATPPSDVEHYADCYGFYNDAMDNFRAAMKYIEEHLDIDKLKYSLHHAAKDYEHCEDQFAAMNGGGPLAMYYDILKQLVSNCKVIANLIHSL